MTSSRPLYLGETLSLESHTIHDYAGTLMQPSTIADSWADNMSEIRYCIWVAVKRAFDQWQQTVPITVDDNWEATRPKIVARAMDQLLIELARQCWSRSPDCLHVTFVDPRLATDPISLVNKTRHLCKLFKDEGVPWNKIVFTIPATDAGIRAARVLLNDQIHVNLSLVSGLTHAAACAEANPASITIPITQLLATHERMQSTALDDLVTHPAIQSINSILGYIRRSAPEIKTIGTGIGNVSTPHEHEQTSCWRAWVLSEIGILQGFDALAISARQAAALKRKRVPIVPLETPRPIAKFPSGMLKKKCGVTSLFSTDAKLIYRDTTLASVARQQNVMEELEGWITFEANLRYKDNIYDLKTLAREEREERKLQKKRERNKVKYELGADSSDTENRTSNASAAGVHREEDEIF